MSRAIELAARGRGKVEPNPMVGCVIVSHRIVVGEGWHREFGGPHAEIEALAAAGDRANGGDAYVTLEPCCHHGKTPPCVEALIAAGVRRVIVAMRDPFEQVAGRGIERLRAAGMEVECGIAEAEARRQNAAYFKLIETGRPWVIAKWAMSLDGKIATRSGESRWISSEASRRRVHELRGLVDAVVVGKGAALADDPLLTARPPGPRVATRVVLDSAASLSPDSQLVRTASESPVLVAAGPDASPESVQRLQSAGCEVLVGAASDYSSRLEELLNELGRRRMTNVLFEGGATVLGALFDACLIDEFHAFIAPTLIGGAAAPSPLAGVGIGKMAESLSLSDVTIEQLGPDVLVSGRKTAV